MTDFNNPTPQFGTAEYVGASDSELAKDTHAAYVRAILFGIGAAILGMILYATFAIVTGIVIGYAALAVGWLVGKAMITGSNGVGGRRYQIAAVLLTYAAVSTAAIPVWIHYSGEHRHSQQKQAAKPADDLGSGQKDDLSGAPPRPSMLSALGTLALLGLASPFLEFSSNPLGAIIGLVILFVGMQFAWKMTGAKP